MTWFGVGMTRIAKIMIQNDESRKCSDRSYLLLCFRCGCVGVSMGVGVIRRVWVWIVMWHVLSHYY